LVKVTARGQNHKQACKRLSRALAEFRVRGVTTNIPFLQNVLTNDQFVNKCVGTSFIDSNKELFDFSASKNRGGKLIAYLGQIAVNGPQTPLATTLEPERVDPKPPAATIGKTGWKHVLNEKGPEGFAKAVRAHKGLLLMDTTYRDAHQSLLATRMRTRELMTCATYTSSVLSNLYSLVCISLGWLS